MHLALTDRFICPRCGPGFRPHPFGARGAGSAGLRRAIWDAPNCRDQYPGQERFRRSETSSPEPISVPSERAGAAPSEAEETLRLGALLGVTEGPGTLLIRGPAARYVREPGGTDRWNRGRWAGCRPRRRRRNRGGEPDGGRSPESPSFPDTFQGVLLSGEVGWTEIWRKRPGSSRRAAAWWFSRGPSEDQKEVIKALGSKCFWTKTGSWWPAKKDRDPCL